MFHDQLFHQIGPLQHDATARVPGAKLAEILQEGAGAHGFVEAARVLNVFHRELNNRARLDVAARADVMADARGHWTERLAAMVVIGVNDGDGQLRAHLHHESAHAHKLIRAQRELEIRFRPDRPVRVIPSVMDAAADEFAQPFLGEQFLNV